MIHELGAVIHYMREQRPHSAAVLARMFVENAHEDWASTPEQVAFFMPFGPGRVLYATTHGTVEANEAFATREDLVAHILGKPGGVE